MKVTKEFKQELKKDNDISFDIRKTGDSVFLCDVTFTYWKKAEIIKQSSYNGFSANLRSFKHGENPYTAHFSEIAKSGNIQALEKLLKVGDDIRFTGQGANNNKLLDDAGLFHDFLQVSIIRYNKDGQAKEIIRNLTISDNVNANNSARSIKA